MADSLGPDPVTRDQLRAELAEFALKLHRDFVSRSHFSRLEEELQEQRLRALSRESIRELIADALRESEARGWTTRERMMGVLLFIITAASFFLNLNAVR